jgi:hypothetical protein
MESATFRKWLVRQGCRIDHGAQPPATRRASPAHREGRKTEIPLGGTHQVLDARVVQRARKELGLDPAQLPDRKTASEPVAEVRDFSHETPQALMFVGRCRFAGRIG